MEVISNFLIRFKAKYMRFVSDIVNEAGGLKLNTSWVLGEYLIKLLCKMNAAIKWFLMTYCFIPESWREKFLIINTETRNCTMCRQCETLEHHPQMDCLYHTTPFNMKESMQKARRKITRVRDSSGIQGNSIFPDTGGLMYIWTQREHDSMHRTYTNSSQAKSQHE